MGALFFCSFSLYANDWNDLQWQRLVLYRNNISEADHQSFFISQKGKTSPEQEFKALIEALKHDDPEEKKNVHCRFPARVRWLKQFREIPDSTVECKARDAFRKRLSAKSISVVFSSYYMNNPGSSFGHTFIRLGKDTLDQRIADKTTTELLDTGINYGALTDGANALVYALGGLSGFFSGNYNAIPYYYKVREYNDFETRDLWSYQLDFTQEEIDLIVDHIWELGNTRFDYYFLTENCAYHVLSILEAARPNINLHAHLPRLYTIPSETLKALEAEKLVKNITFRPAPSTLFYHQLDLLKEDERKEVNELLLNKKLSENLTPERKALIYDTAISLVDFKYAKLILKGNAEAQEMKKPLLIGRSKIPVRSPEPDFSKKLLEGPHLGHGQKRLAISYINKDSRSLLDVEWRFAFHDFLDNSLGFPPKTRMDIMKGTLRTDGENYQLRDLSIIDTMLLGKRDSFNQSPSWKVKLGQWQTRYQQNDLTTQGFQGGYGLSYEYDLFTPYLLAHLETSYVSEKQHKVKVGYGADLGMLIEFTSALKLHTVLEWRVHPWNESRFLNEVRYSNTSYGVGGSHASYLTDGVQEFAVKFYKYFK